MTRPLPSSEPAPASRDAYFAALRAAAALRPQETFLTILGAQAESVGFAAFLARTEQAAGALAAAGIRPGDRVLLFCDTRIDLFTAFFGAQMAGAVPAIMPPLTPKQDAGHWRASHAELIRRIAPAAVLAPPTVLEDLGAALDGWRAMDIALPGSPVAARPAATGHAALLQHSSGTTGLKKGVMLGYPGVLAQLRTYARALALGPNDRIVSWLPLYHDMGLVACTILPMVTATPVTVIDPFTWLGDPLRLMRAAAHDRATLMWLPNFAFEHLAGAARGLRREVLDLSALRMVVNCSEVCRAASIDRFAAAYAPHGLDAGALHCCYALAENVFAAAQSLPGEGPLRVELDLDALEAGRILPAGPHSARRGAFVSSGRPLPGCEVAIRAGGPQTATGEVLLRSDCLFDGYFADPALSAERLDEGWLHTRDTGFLLDGHVFVTGRLDDVINYRGRKLAAPDLEAVLAGLPGLRPGRAVAFGVPDERIGSEQVVVLVETADGAPSTAFERQVRERLEAHCGVNPIRVGIQPPGTLAKTTSGKISRVLNRARHLEDTA